MNCREMALWTFSKISFPDMTTLKKKKKKKIQIEIFVNQKQFILKWSISASVETALYDAFIFHVN